MDHESLSPKRLIVRGRALVLCPLWVSPPYPYGRHIAPMWWWETGPGEPTQRARHLPPQFTVADAIAAALEDAEQQCAA